MSGFIDINRLDYVDPEQIHIPEEFSELQQIHASYNKQVVTFLIKNSLKNKNPVSFRRHLSSSGSVSGILGNGICHPASRKYWIRSKNCFASPLLANGIACGY